jgi:hypothetical protein
VVLMAASTLLSPPRWTDRELQTEIGRSIAIFRDERVMEPLDHYRAQFKVSLGAVRQLLDQTRDLLDLPSQAHDVMRIVALADIVRYLASPPISLDDLRLVAGVEQTSPAALRRNPETAVALVHAVLDVVDRMRFPWLVEGRVATAREREAAALATAVLAATERVRTLRRNEGKLAQEDAVRQSLLRNNFVHVARRTIDTLMNAPGPGEFCDESALAGRKADIIVRLLDGRVMPVECKVSNSFTNSIKRVNNDAAVKAVTWTAAFGQRNVVPVAVLSGAFKLKNLRDAQDANLTLFWAHDLAQMTAWIDRAL